ncbi:MAG: CPBP family intramembrane metalloprotease [Anaerolineaceae bacterium]|nr:CPBP family intramembrane metalloprotease [Anaerolineaceae bacterium]
MTVLVTSYPESFEVPPLDPTRWTGSTLLIDNRATFLSIFYQLGYAAVSEEPIFRGFLWGYLRKSGYREVWIWLFIAGLFVLAHLNYLKTAPILFGFTVPLSALVLGWLAWRSRSNATSMVAHGVMNGLGYFLAFLVAAIRL